MSNQVEKFQENFRSVVENTAYLLDDAKFKQDHGFSFAEYVTKGNLNDLTKLDWEGLLCFTFPSEHILKS